MFDSPRSPKAFFKSARFGLRDAFPQQSGAWHLRDRTQMKGTRDVLEEI
jgi:hypothetical protein